MPLRMTLDLINPSISNNDYWNNPSNWAKPVNGGFNPNSQNIQAQAGGAATGPLAMAQTNTNENSNGSNQQSQQSNLQSPTVGNTANATSGTANGIIASNNQTLLNPAGNAQQQPQQQQTGLNPSTFSNAIGTAGKGLFNQLTGTTGGIQGAINSLGTSLGFGTGSSTLGAVTGSQASLLASYGVAPGASSVAAASAADGVGGFTGYGAQAGGGLTSASLSSVLGGAGFGVGIGGLIAGFTGGNQTGGMIGGGIGGALGAATGISSGITMGATLGSIVPGLGTVIGAVAGSLLGGMLGNKSPPTNADSWYAKLTPTGSLNYNTQGGGSKNPGPITGFGQQGTEAFSALAQSAGATLGIQYNPNITANVAISTKHPGPNGDTAAIEIDTTNGGGQYDSGRIYFNPSDNTSVANAYYQALVGTAAQSGYTDTQSLYNWFYGQGPVTGTGSNRLAGNNVMIAPRV